MELQGSGDCAAWWKEVR